MRESLRLFMLCDATRWTHLPVAGGWYDQSPAFIRQLYIIFGKKAEHDRKAEAQKKQKAQQKSGKKRGR